MALLGVERLFLTPVCKMKRQDSANRAKVQRSSHTHFFLNRFVLEMRHVQITEPQSGRASEEKKTEFDFRPWCVDSSAHLGCVA